MLHHLVPDEVAPGSLEPNLDFYEPRTAHGSSLSPAIHAALLARAGRYRRRARGAAHRRAASTSTTSPARPRAGSTSRRWAASGRRSCSASRESGRSASDSIVDPRLPPQWNALELALRFRGEPLRLRIDRDRVSADSASWTVRETTTTSGRLYRDEEESWPHSTAALPTGPCSLPRLQSEACSERARRPSTSGRTATAPRAAPRPPRTCRSGRPPAPSSIA